MRDIVEAGLPVSVLFDALELMRRCGCVRPGADVPLSGVDLDDEGADVSRSAAVVASDDEGAAEVARLFSPSVPSESDRDL